MELNRKELKAEAKMRRKESVPAAALVTLVYVVIAVLLPGGLDGIFGINVSTDTLNSALSDPSAATFAVIFAGVGILSSFISILMALFQTVMGYGYASYALDRARGEQAGFDTLLDGFSIAGKAILTSIVVFVFSFLWGLAFSVPAGIITGVLVALGAADIIPIALAVGLGVVLSIAAGILSYTKVIYYSLTSFTLLDDPNGGATEAVRKSKEMMRGRRWFYFKMSLSFIPWWILTGLTLGILSLWVDPYVRITEALFYEKVRLQMYTNTEPGEPVFTTPDPF